MLIFCFISNAIGCLFMSMHVYKTRYGRNLKRRGTDSCPSPTKSIYSLSFALLTNSAVFLLNFKTPGLFDKKKHSYKKTSIAD